MITVTIGGVDRTSSIIFNSIRKTDNLNQQVDNLDFIVRKYGSLTYTPELGDEVIIVVDGDTVFGGVIVRIKENVQAANIIQYSVTCNDYSQYLKRKLVTERYVSTTVAVIAADIVDTYAPEFTTTAVVGTVEVTSAAFNRLTVAESFQKLADALGYVWYVDYDYVIHFFPKNEEPAPFDLTDTSANYVYDSLEIVEDLTQVKNTVLVQGGEKESSSTRTETYVGNGTKVEYVTANKFSETPVVVVNGVTKTVGTEFLDADASFECMWNYNQKYIRFTSGNTPSNGHAITITAKYLIPIVVSVPSPASIAEFGEYEFAITDKSIESQGEAIDRAIAELQSYQNELYDGRFVTYEGGLRSGQVLNINSAQRGKNIDVVIQSVTMRMREPTGANFEYEVRFATLKKVGIIDYLQRQLRSREIITDDLETLLNLKILADTVAVSDAIGTPVTQTAPYKWGTLPAVLDSYPEVNQNANANDMRSDSVTEQGQTFSAAAASTITSCKFYLRKLGSPTGTIKAKLYAMTGTLGTDGVPTGTFLTESESLDVATGLTTSYVTYEFTFPRRPRINIPAATGYCIALEATNVTGDASNNVQMGAKNGTGHTGNRFYKSGGVYTADAAREIIFYVYGGSSSTGRWNFSTWG